MPENAFRRFLIPETYLFSAAKVGELHVFYNTKVAKNKRFIKLKPLSRDICYQYDVCGRS